MKKSDDFLFDVRIAYRHLRDGVISKKDYDKYIKGLPDMESNSEPLIIEDENEGAQAETVQAETAETEEEQTE